ncbi:hypothetical protein [Fusobacterium sp. PH5-44]|uniref:hypothetical protein n=1 Tax=unclassified Fusobacterium TaxID=2648384 RepID=UPI003D25D08B
MTTYYKDGKNIGPFNMYNDSNKFIYSIYIKNGEYILKINQVTYSPKEQSLFIKQAKLSNISQDNKLNLSKEKEKIFFTLLKELKIDPNNLPEDTSFFHDEKYPYFWMITAIILATFIIIGYIFIFQYSYLVKC